MAKFNSVDVKSGLMFSDVENEAEVLLFDRKQSWRETFAQLSLQSKSAALSPFYTPILIVHNYVKRHFLTKSDPDAVILGCFTTAKMQIRRI